MRWLTSSGDHSSLMIAPSTSSCWHAGATSALLLHVPCYLACSLLLGRPGPLEKLLAPFRECNVHDCRDNNVHMQVFLNGVGGTHLEQSCTCTELAKYVLLADLAVLMMMHTTTAMLLLVLQVLGE
jgi:hypothetical protein